jgi:hypothetical protein
VSGGLPQRLRNLLQPDRDANLIAIPLLVVLTGIVYYRISIDFFSPPYYSIWIRPGDFPVGLAQVR